MKRWRTNRQWLLSTGALFVFLLGYQNCSLAKFSVSRESNFDTQLSGNPDGYSGKLDLFSHYDAAAPCAETDRMSNSLPNAQIFFQSKSGSTTEVPFLVRERCQDISPRELNSSELVIASPGDSNFTYSGQTFAPVPQGQDFNVVASRCPAGKTERPSAPRINLLSSSLDWLARPPWMWHLGISVGLNGSIQSLPSFQVSRTDPNHLEGYERPSQFQNLLANTDYVYSFVAKAGTSDGATVRIHRFGSASSLEENLVVDFNLRSGTASLRVNTNVAAPTLSIVPFGSGYLCTVYFRTSASAAESEVELGVGPMDPGYIARVGDTVYATAVQLERVDEFCQ